MKVYTDRDGMTRDFVVSQRNFSRLVSVTFQRIATACPRLPKHDTLSEIHVYYSRFSIPTASLCDM